MVLIFDRIISTVLHWDIRDLENRASKIEKDSESPSKDQIQCLRDYAIKAREEQEDIRKQSRKGNYGNSDINPLTKSRTKFDFDSHVNIRVLVSPI